MTLPSSTNLKNSLKPKIDSVTHEGYLVNLVYLYPIGCLILVLPTIFNLSRLFNYQFHFYDELTGSLTTGLWAVMWFSFITVGYLAILTKKEKLAAQQISAITLFAVCCLLTAAPLGSTDVFYYLGAARDEILQGVNPYLGGFFKLNPFLTTTITICGPIMYPPFWLQINKLLWTLSQSFGTLGQVYFYKLFFLLCHVATASIIAKITKNQWSIVNNQLSIIYLLNPLLLFEFATNAHFDALMLLFVALFVYFVTRKSTVPAILTLTIAVLVKYTAVLFSPLLLWLLLTNKNWSIKQLAKWTLGGSAALVLTTASFWPYWSQIGSKMLVGISLQSDWFVNSLFSTFYVPIIWLYQNITSTTIPSISAKYLWLTLIFVGTFVIFRFLINKKIFSNFQHLASNFSWKVALEVTILTVVVFTTFFQRSFWPWYATWPLLTGVLLGTENRIFKLSLIFTLSSFAFYLIYTLFGFNSTQTLDNLQVLYGLVVFGPVIYYLIRIIRNNSHKFV